VIFKKKIDYHFFQAYTPIPMLTTNNTAIAMERGPVRLSGSAAGDGTASVDALVVLSWTGVCVGAADCADVSRGFGVNRTGLAIGVDPDESIKRRSLTLFRDMPLEIFVPYINSNAFKSILLNEVTASDPE
jgi:hypothetical protein